MSSVILAEHIAITSAGQTAKIPASVRKMLQRVTLDAYGLMLSARNTDYIQAIQSSCVDHGDTTAFGHGSRFTMQDAVLINGTAVHGEDFDDTFEGTPVHVSSVIIPTILAIAEQEDLPPDKFIGAMAFGAELICRLALVAPTAIHRQGFHPTAILGAFGASLTASIAYGLSAQQTAQRSELSAPWPQVSSNISQKGRGPKECIQAGPPPPGSSLPSWLKPDLLALGPYSRERMDYSRGLLMTLSLQISVTLSHSGKSGFPLASHSNPMPAVP